MEQGQQLEAQQQKLIEGEQTLQTKVESFRTQKEVIKAQYSAAEAQVRIGEAATGIGEKMADVGLAIQRAKDKTEQMQARAAAVDELTAAGALEDFTSTGDDIDRQLAQISQSGQVDDELAKLKAELGATGERGRRSSRRDRPRDGRGAVARRRRARGRLNELDDEVGRALEAGDQAALSDALRRLADDRRERRHAARGHRPRRRTRRAARGSDARRGARAARGRGPDPGPCS